MHSRSRRTTPGLIRSFGGLVRSPGGRIAVTLGEEKSSAVCRRCDAHIEKHGVKELFTRSRYAVAVLP